MTPYIEMFLNNTLFIICILAQIPFVNHTGLDYAHRDIWDNFVSILIILKVSPKMPIYYYIGSKYLI